MNLCKDCKHRGGSFFETTGPDKGDALRNIAAIGAAIAHARACYRLHVDERGFGYVYIGQIQIPEQAIALAVGIAASKTQEQRNGHH